MPFARGDAERREPQSPDGDSLGLGRTLRVLCIALVASAGIQAPTSRAFGAPDPVSAASELARTPLRVAGDLLGGAGGVAAGGLVTLGDGVALVDRAPGLRRVSRGALSGLVRRIAFGISFTTGRTLELLRWEDVERLPEPAAAFVEASPGYGRIGLVAGGLGALRLALSDALSGPAIALFHALGASGTAEALERDRDDARLRWLGPSPAPAPTVR